MTVDQWMPLHDRRDNLVLAGHGQVLASIARHEGTWHERGSSISVKGSEGKLLPHLSLEGGDTERVSTERDGDRHRRGS